MTRITKRTIDSLKPPTSGSRFLWDSELRGFGLRMSPQGRVAFIVQYRTPQGRTRRYSFAVFGPTTADQARAQARQLLAAAHTGRDPSTERHDERSALTVAQLCGTYLEALRAGQVLTRFHQPKRPSTVYNDEGRIARHIIPLIGSKLAASLTRADVQRMADAITAGKTAGTFKTKARGKAVVEGGPSTAARVVELLGGVWSWAEKRGYVSGLSPVKGVEKHRSSPRDRTLDNEELGHLGAVLRENAGTAANAVRLIAVTGLRQGEATGLKWSEVDDACLRLEATKTGRSTRPIGRAASEFLASLPRHGELVFNPVPSKKQIAALFDLAGLPDARSHALRRTYASAAAGLWPPSLSCSATPGVGSRRGITSGALTRC